ncbi:terpenoid synthase [Mycena metata]|uniref:Terpene synthase n=1 Tax=Mycena metata TaxID=1033252 RepID=A0AAD7MKY1_9AGAR|nr:terpenoid synthase [Mycena metata]
MKMVMVTHTRPRPAQDIYTHCSSRKWPCVRSIIPSFYSSFVVHVSYSPNPGVLAWARVINPHYLRAKAESSAWLEGFGAFNETAQAAFNKCDFNLLASLAYPAATMEHLRTCCDLMNLFFVFDEYTDCVNKAEVQQLADIVMDALRHPHKARSSGESIIGEIARQFWCRASVIANPICQRRFIDTFDHYTASVVAQAANRDRRHILSISDYFITRRENIGAKPSFALLDLETNVPDEIMAHPCIELLTVYIIDMLIIGNDLCSFRVEFCRDDADHNVLTVVMRQFGIDLTSAVLWVKNYHSDLVQKFFTVVDELPHWGKTEIDDHVANYVQGLGNWVRANDAWSFESQRYFGTKGLDVQAHRVVRLESLDQKHVAHL